MKLRLAGNLLAATLVLAAIGCESDSPKPDDAAVPPLDTLPRAGAGGDEGWTSHPGDTGVGVLPDPGAAGAGKCGEFAPTAPTPAPPDLVSPKFGDGLVRAGKAPPPISGGTLLTSSDGQTLIAADPDRDAIYLVDVEKRTLTRRIQLQAGDEPGRVAQDKSGTVHVALRGGRGIVSFALTADAPVRRTELCDLPRGLAYDGVGNRLYLACSEGAVVEVDPATGKSERRFSFGRDLRDVVVRGRTLLVTRFRAAELLHVDIASGTLLATHKPAVETREEVIAVEDKSSLGTPNNCGGNPTHTENRKNRIEPEVAWRAIDVPGQGLLMLHQRAGASEVHTTSGGYGGARSSCANGIVQNTLTVGDDANRSVDIAMPGLLVDVAADSTGTLLAVANPGGWQAENSVTILPMPGTEIAVVEEDAGVSSGSCTFPTTQIRVEGQATSVSFATPWLLAVQERQPAAISFIDIRTSSNAVTRLDLQQSNQEDTGHTLFHLTTPAGIACASCHAEGGDDGHVWTFDGIGARRTQNLRGGILGSEPFHWNGDMADFPALVNEVFVGRMSAPVPSPDKADALAHWIDSQPVLHATPADATAVERGKALFESAAVGCTQCHNGTRLARNEGADVGTGALLQVPSLRGVSFRAPFIHNGCAPTLNDRFGPCGGGDKHGHTSQLSSEQVKDLVAYLESL